MARYMLHLVNGGNEPRNAKRLLGEARSICAGMAVTVRDCRVSTRCVEFDISINSQNVDELVERLLPIGSLDNAKLVTEECIEKEAAVKLGIEYFNSERFWECHEVLEGVWKGCVGEERNLVQGIILVAAALVHYQKYEDHICVSIFGRALEKLENSAGEYCGIDVEFLRSTVSDMRASKNVQLFTI